MRNLEFDRKQNMTTTATKELPGAALWDRVLQFDDTITPTAARALLKMKFSAPDLELMQGLAAKARRGGLSESEAIEIDTFERLGCLLDILHSKSRRVLNRHSRTV